MSTLKTKPLDREFFDNGTRIPDPAPSVTAQRMTGFGTFFANHVVRQPVILDKHNAILSPLEKVSLSTM